MLKIMYVHLFLLNFAKIFYIINFVCGEFNFYPTCSEENMDKLKILLAKGRIYESVYELLNDVGISIYLPDRQYFPVTNQKDLAFQVVKPQITSLLLANDKADLGFSGKDWVYENGVEDKVVEIMDLGFDPVRIVAAIPENIRNTGNILFKNYHQLTFL